MLQMDKMGEWRTMIVGTIHRYNPFVMKLVTIVVLINAFVITLAGISLYQSNVLYEHHAALITQNLSRISANYIDGVCDKANMVLILVSEQAGRQSLEGKIRPQLFQSFNQLKRIDTWEMDALWVTDSQGRIVSQAGIETPQTDHIGNSSIFERLRDNPKEGLVFSEPQPGETNSEWKLKLARRINGADGSFAGVVYGTIGIQHFIKAFAAIDVGKNGSITLRNSDLAIIARYSKSEGFENIPVGNKVVSYKLQQLVASGLDNATYKAVYPADGRERIYSFNKISSYPLIVIVGIATDTYLAQWRSDATKVTLAIFMFFLCSLFVARYILNRWKLQQKTITSHQESEECFRAIFENALVGTLLMTPDGQIIKANLMLENLLGYQIAELNNINIKDIIFPDDYDIDREMYQSMLEGMRNYYQAEKRIVTNYGTVIWGMLGISVVRDDSGKPRFVIYVIDDISARKGAEERLHYQSTHDGMTGLHNRTFFDEEFHRMQFGLSFPVSMIVIDLDGLKQVNDKQGHEAGDKLIKGAGVIIREVFRHDELAARVGGDEFAVLLPKTDEDATDALVELLRESQHSFNSSGDKVKVFFSAGAATAHNSRQLSELWKRADDRMYTEKALHKSML